MRVVVKKVAILLLGLRDHIYIDIETILEFLLA